MLRYLRTDCHRSHKYLTLLRLSWRCVAVILSVLDQDAELPMAPDERACVWVQPCLQERTFTLFTLIRCIEYWCQHNLQWQHFCSRYCSAFFFNVYISEGHRSGHPESYLWFGLGNNGTFFYNV